MHIKHAWDKEIGIPKEDLYFILEKHLRYSQIETNQKRVLGWVVTESGWIETQLDKSGNSKNYVEDKRELQNLQQVNEN